MEGKLILYEFKMGQKLINLLLGHTLFLSEKRDQLVLFH
jgi:hypothetical protein